MGLNLSFKRDYAKAQPLNLTLCFYLGLETMTEIDKILSSTEFWFVTVFVSLTINVISSFLSAFVMKTFSSFVASWENRNRESKLAHQLLVNKYSSSYQQLYLGKLEKNHKKLEVIFDFSLATVILLFGNGSSFNDVTNIVALFPAFSGLLDTVRHGRFMLVITEAELELEKLNKQIQPTAKASAN